MVTNVLFAALRSVEPEGPVGAEGEVKVLEVERHDELPEAILRQVGV